MPAVPFPSSSTPGRLAGEGEGRLINAYVEKGGTTPYWRRVPGLVSLATVHTEGVPRGIFEVSGSIFVAYADHLERVNATDFSHASVGTIPGTDGVTFAANNRVLLGESYRDLVAVRESGGAYLIDVSSSAFDDFPAGILPSTANSVSFLGGYFLFTVADGRIFASELNSTTLNALSFATAESASDGLVRGIVANNRLYAMGTTTIEPWLNVGNTPFPLARATTVIGVGLLTAMAVAGFGEGWDLNPFFVAHDGTVREITGYTTKIVSTPDVEAFIAQSTISTLEASVYTFRGRPIWSLSSDQGTWELEVTSGFWHERVSVGLDRWRGSRTVKSNGQWVMGDQLSGALLALSDTTRTEVDAALTWTVESAAFKEFPVPFAVPDVFFLFTPTASATASISWSIDGGYSWGDAIDCDLLPDGLSLYPVRVNVREQVTHHGIRFRMVVSDTADFSFMGASVPAPEPRAP